MAELVQTYEDRIQSITLVPSDEGRFEVTVDGELIYSKLSTGRHAEPGEIARLMGERLGEDRGRG
ncbi:MAG: Rdx family protein [Actinobacteria bacterium]|nr:Rdx family protein [Actinomycetota bacterium]